ncbi:MAG: RagB/SusD family nutrient uptake outer membrane protein [Dysgonamonadaceae bacterium]|nr:RagB/SusD family nutrient uptake outer membrane protein [Dysgonamonadaceae bacterium]
MKRIRQIILIGFLLGTVLCNSSCNKYLDLVPDNVVILENYFSRRESAWNTLSKVYSYIPNDEDITQTSWTLGDEWIGEISTNRGISVSIDIMRGLQNSGGTLLSLWDGTSGGKSLYEGIRSANIFLDYIDIVEDMTPDEIANWKAQVKFLKAYFHFLLLRQYGPVVIMDKSIPLDAVSDDLFLRRNKVEDCFNFIINLMNEAIPDLTERASISNLGQIDRVAALAIKARIMLYRASPFFNGNRSYYEDFLDHNGEPFFPLDYKAEKWQDALDAVEEAITLCETNGLGLYEYDKNSYAYDREDFALNNNIMKVLYDLRMLIVDPWNKEVIWGKTYAVTNNILTSASNIILPIGYGDGITNSVSFSRQLFGASYRMLERYYTKNGLPLSEDITFDSYTKYDIITTPGIEDPEYQALRGLLQPGADIVKLYMDREPRFYANLGITGGYWRSHAVRINSLMFYGSDGGASPNFPSNFLCTGIGVQKFAHPEAKSDGYQMQVKYPLPIIRMADLYLMKAEILNEINGPGPDVWAEINKIRRRAGIPDVEDVWSDATLVNPRSQNNHLDKDKLRDIILQERGIELAFEGGNRFWDMHRQKRALIEFSSSIMGWDYSGFNAEYFFAVTPVQTRRFLFRDLLWPISVDEININSNLIQNPGW